MLFLLDKMRGISAAAGRRSTFAMGEEEVGLQDVTQGGYKALRQGKKFFLAAFWWDTVSQAHVG